MQRDPGWVAGTPDTPDLRGQIVGPDAAGFPLNPGHPLRAADVFPLIAKRIDKE